MEGGREGGREGVKEGGREGGKEGDTLLLEALKENKQREKAVEI